MNSKSTSPGNRAAAQHNPPASSKTASQQGHSGHSCELPVQDATKCNTANDACSQTLNTGSSKIDDMEPRNQALQAGRKTGGGKKERERCSISSTVQQQQGDGHMAKNGERAKTRRVDVSKKAMKGIIGRGSQMGRLTTVHVAS